MSKKISQRTLVLFMLLLFLGSVVAGAIEYGIGRQKASVPDTNIISGALTQEQAYAILSRGLVLLRYSVPEPCDFYCQAEVQKVEAVVKKYAPYVFLEEIKSGTKAKIVAATYSGARAIDEVDATAVEDTVCLAIPLHPECRKLRAMQAIEDTGNESSSPQNVSQNNSATNAVNESQVSNSTTNQTNVSLG